MGSGSGCLRFVVLRAPAGGLPVRGASVWGAVGRFLRTQGPGIQQVMRFAQTTQTLIAVVRDQNAAAEGVDWGWTGGEGGGGGGGGVVEGAADGAGFGVEDGVPGPGGDGGGGDGGGALLGGD